jgi:predicted anti-sigma-YlaC factor YlaD
MTMGCEPYMVAISAQVDGEDPDIDTATLEEHLQHCASCRRFADDAASMRRRSRVGAAPDIPDLSRQVVQRTAAADRSSAAWMARWLLALVAVQIVVLAVPDLLASGESAHASRHLGAFGLAYAAGLIVVVVRPARARTMLQVALVLAAAMVVAATVDIAQGRVPLVNEAIHIPELFSLLFLWLLTRPPGKPRDDQGPVSGDRSEDVRAVDGGDVDDVGARTQDPAGATVHPLRRGTPEAE